MTDQTQRRLPPWLRKRIPAGGTSRQVMGLLGELGLATVCTEARCPNQSECHAMGTATFLIMGQQCTRQCRFCAVAKGSPLPLREDEPAAVAEACVRMGLKYVVVTSVTRDDLPDGGAAHFARTIAAIRGRLPQTIIEVLTPDFLGSTAAMDTVLAAGPDVFDHNVETVPRLYAAVRPSAGGTAPDYRRSLDVLAYAKKKTEGETPSGRMGETPMPHAGETPATQQPHAGETPATQRKKMLVKSGLMLGVGETDDEIRAVLADLRHAGVDILTLGQYLAPSSDHWPVARYVEPAEFAQWETHARKIGFSAVLAGPFVRSSYHAQTVFEEPLQD